LAESNHTIAENLLNAFLNSIKNSSPDPNWKYDINIFNNRFSIIETPQTELAVKQLPHKTEIKIKVPEKYERFENLMELLEYARRKQITVNLEVEEIKQYIGSHIVEHIISKYRYNYVIEFIPPPYPILNVDIEFPDVNLMFYNVNLKVIEITGNNKVKCSNKDQKDCNIEFFFVLNFNDTYNFIEKYDFIVLKIKKSLLKVFCYGIKSTVYLIKVLISKCIMNLKSYFIMFFLQVITI
jgi:hypothetical protein